jgi:predicted transcriptional regulator
MIGRIFGFLLIAYGVYSFVMGSLMSGLWWFLIGLFLNNAARTAYQQLRVRIVLEGEKVSRFMKTNPVTVPEDITVSEMVDDYVYSYHYKLFPVVRGDNLVGCITTKQIKELSRAEWTSTTVGEISEDCTDENSVPPDMGAVKVLGVMRRKGASRLMVVDGEKLAGVITLKDLLEFVALKLDLDREDS